MKYRKTIIFLMFAIFIFSITAVSASDMNDTAIDSNDISQMGLSANCDVDNLKLSEENTTLIYANNVESVGVGIDSEVLSADASTYSGLAEEIGQGGNIELQHTYYTYDIGNPIEITVGNSVIDGRGAIIDMAGSNIRAFHVTASGVTIKNLTIKNANHKGNGSAIYFSSSGTVTNCNFTNNTAHDGGAIYLYSGNVTNCNFTNNTAYNGGAVHFYNQGTVINCNFINNTASVEGGAIKFFNDKGSVENCNFVNNQVFEDPGYGGAVYFNREGNVTNCKFTKNTAYDGGAVYFYHEGNNVANCNFTNNTASKIGGAVYFYYGGIMTDCIFTNNHASGDGGAIRFYNGKGTVTNCNFTNNSATDCGGAVYFYYEGNVANCNFTDNTANNAGGAIRFYGVKGTVTNCNFTNNTSIVGGAIASKIFNAVTVDTCIFKTRSDTTDNILLDPGLDINVDNVTEESNATIRITTKSTFNGEVTVIIGDKNYTVTLVNGEGSCNITDLKAGNYTATVILEQTEAFQSTNKTISFTVKSKENPILPVPELNIKVDNVTEGSNATITINTNKTYNGEATVIIGDENYPVTLVNGEGSGNVSDLKAGNYTATVILKQTDKFQSTNKTINFTVKNKENQTLINPELNEGTYSDLRNEIRNGGNINLTKNYYHYVNGDGKKILITTPGVINGQGAVIDMAGSGDAFFVKTNGVEFKNLTIKNALFSGVGAAIYFSSECQSGTVINCNFINNTASGDGGAVHFYNQGTVINCNFTDNTASQDGGAIRMSSGNVTNCNFINNTASDTGGAINFDSIGSVTNCNFTNNRASNGGAVWMFSGTVTNCNFTNNSAITDGGAIFFQNRGTVTNCNFTNNIADSGGAILFANPGNVTNCNFTNNIADSGGAILFANLGNVTNCNFADNNAYYGGAISFNYGNGELTNCNFTANTASDDGGALYFVKGGTIKNCNFVGNRATGEESRGGAIYMSSGAVTYSNFTNNSAIKGGAIFSQLYNAVTLDSCILKTSSDTTYNILLNLGLNIKVGDVTEGSNATITITTNIFYNGKVTVYLKYKNYSVKITNDTGTYDIGVFVDIGEHILQVTNSTCSFNVSGLKAGTYTATIISNKTETFNVSSKTVNFTVKNKQNQTLIDPELNIKVDNVTEGSNATITITTNSTFNGEVTVKIGDKNYTVPVINGEGSCNITGLKAGNYTATVISKQTDKFQPTNKTTNFTVKSKENPILVDPGLNINIDNITEGSNATITINTDKTYNGEVTVKIGDKNYSVTLVNGEGSCNITGLKAGNYITTVILKQTDKFNASSKTINFTVKSKPMGTVIKSSVVTTTYATSKNIIITLTDKQGKALNDKKVTVILNGVSKTLTTNNKGQGILATGTTLTPKTYKVSFKFAGDTSYVESSGSVNLVVKKSTPKLTAKNKKYKEKTKNKKYTITLKNDKKQAIKNVKLTLKVNGKTYTAKTNNKGKAIFEIKKLTKKGKYKTTITFKTNQYYNKITTKTTITIK